MKEKNNQNIVKEILYILAIELPVAAFGIMLIIGGILIKGVFLNICWNMVMPAIFGVKSLSFLQASILALTIKLLKEDIQFDVKNNYFTLKDYFLEKNIKNLAKQISAILAIVFVLIQIIITIVAMKYSWNTILPDLLNIKLVHINFWQAFSFAYVLNLILRTMSNPINQATKKENTQVIE